MNEVNGNTPTTSATPTSPAAPSVEELAAKVAELEKQSEGRLRDLQNERQKRQDLEARMNQPVAPASSPVQPDAMQQDELGKILTPYVKAYVAPLEAKLKEAEGYVAKSVQDKAMDHLATKTGKSKDAILQDKDFQDKLVSIVRRYGFAGNTYDVTVKAYEIMELENYKAAEAERARQATAASSGSLPSGTPPPPVMGSKEYSQNDWANLPLHEYEKLQAAGTFTENEAGKIVFTPNK